VEVLRETGTGTGTGTGRIGQDLAIETETEIEALKGTGTGIKTGTRKTGQDRGIEKETEIATKAASTPEIGTGAGTIGASGTEAAETSTTNGFQGGMSPLTEAGQRSVQAATEADHGREIGPGPLIPTVAGRWTKVQTRQERARYGLRCYARQATTEAGEKAHLELATRLAQLKGTEVGQTREVINTDSHRSLQV
jgi:hypothetical protein